MINKYKEIQDYIYALQDCFKMETNLDDKTIDTILLCSVGGEDGILSAYDMGVPVEEFFKEYGTEV